MSKTANGRLTWPDLLRTAAVLAGILVWLASGGLSQAEVGTSAWQAFHLYNSLLRWCAPVLVMLSGMFVLDPKRGMTLPRLLLGRILRVLLAVVLWGAIYIVAAGLLDGGGLSWGGVLWALLRALRADTWEYLWFLYIILGLYIVAPILRAFVRGADRGELHFFLLLAFLVAALLPTLLALWPNAAAQRWLDKLDIHLVLGFCGYYVLGYYLKEYTLSRPAEYLIYLLGAAGMVVTVGGTWALSQARGSTVYLLYDYCSPNVALTALAVCVLFRYVLGVSDERSRRQRFSGAARVSMGTYLFAGLLLLILQAVGIGVFSLHPALAVPLLGLGVFLAAFALAWLLSHLPLVGRYLT